MSGYDGGAGVAVWARINYQHKSREQPNPHGRIPASRRSVVEMGPGARARCVPDRAGNPGESRSLTGLSTGPLTWHLAGSGHDVDDLLSSGPPGAGAVRNHGETAASADDCLAGLPAGSGHGPSEPADSLMQTVGSA